MSESKRLRQAERDAIDDRVLNALKRSTGRMYSQDLIREQLCGRYNQNVVAASLRRLVALGAVQTGKDVTRKDHRGRPWFQISIA